MMEAADMALPEDESARISSHRDGNVRKIRMNILVDDVEVKIDEMVRNMKSTQTVSGFRKGRAPEFIFRKRFTPDVRKEIAMDMARDSFKEHLSDIEEEPMTFLRFELTEGKDEGVERDVDIQFIVRPHIPDVDFTKLELKVFEPASAEDMSQDAILQFLQNTMKYTEADSGYRARLEDRVTLSPVAESTEGEEVPLVELIVDSNANIHGQYIPLEEATVGDTVQLDHVEAVDADSQFADTVAAGSDLRVVKIETQKAEEFNDALAVAMGYQDVDMLGHAVVHEYYNRFRRLMNGYIDEQVRWFINQELAFEVPGELISHLRENISGTVESLPDQDVDESGETDDKPTTSVAVESDADKGEAVDQGEGAATESEEPVKIPEEQIRYKMYLEHFCDKNGLHVGDEEILSQWKSMCMQRGFPSDTEMPDDAAEALWLSIAETKLKRQIHEQVKINKQNGTITELVDHIDEYVATADPR